MATSAHYSQSKDVKSVFKDECISTAKLFTYSSMWNMHGLSSILNTKILSIYPMYNLRLRPLYHRLVYPREQTHSAHDSCIAIMWTRTPPLPLSTTEWNPNHFVPCVPLSRLSLEQTTGSSCSNGMTLQSSGSCCSLTNSMALQSSASSGSNSTSLQSNGSSCSNSTSLQSSASSGSNSTPLQSSGRCSVHEFPPPDLAVYKPRHETTPAVTSVYQTPLCLL